MKKRFSLLLFAIVLTLLFSSVVANAATMPLISKIVATKGNHKITISYSYYGDGLVKQMTRTEKSGTNSQTFKDSFVYAGTKLKTIKWKENSNSGKMNFIYSGNKLKETSGNIPQINNNGKFKVKTNSSGAVIEVVFPKLSYVNSSFYHKYQYTGAKYLEKMITKTDGRGDIIRNFTYDGQGNLTSQTNSGTTYTYKNVYKLNLLTNADMTVKYANDIYNASGTYKITYSYANQSFSGDKKIIEAQQQILRNQLILRDFGMNGYLWFMLAGTNGNNNSSEAQDVKSDNSKNTSVKNNNNKTETASNASANISSAIVSKVKLKKPKIDKIQEIKDDSTGSLKEVKVSFKEDSSVDGYEIEISSSCGKYIVKDTYSEISKKSFLVQKGVKTAFRVRSYKNDTLIKHFSPWSEKKAITIIPKSSPSQKIKQTMKKYDAVGGITIGGDVPESVRYNIALTDYNYDSGKDQTTITAVMNVYFTREPSGFGNAIGDGVLFMAAENENDTDKPFVFLVNGSSGYVTYSNWKISPKIVKKNNIFLSMKDGPANVCIADIKSFYKNKMLISYHENYITATAKWKATGKISAFRVKGSFLASGNNMASKITYSFGNNGINANVSITPEKGSIMGSWAIVQAEM